jgi:hypothetical protein
MVQACSTSRYAGSSNLRSQPPAPAQKIENMRNKTRTVFVFAGVIAIGCLTGAAMSDDADTVPYPAGYRHWTFLHSSMVGAKFSGFGKGGCESPCTGGIYHFYGNDKAMVGLQGGSYADGAVIAEEMLEIRGGTEGPRRLVGVMVKNSRKYAATGGWGYGHFTGDSQAEDLTHEERVACYQCHIPKKDRDFVFTEYRER